MATIDYKEKYEQALERARQFSEKPYLEDSAGIVEYIFPELKESEDERIMKEIIAHIKWCEDGGYCAKEEMTRWIAWLEKQGKSNIGISVATKQKLEDNLNKALEKETSESCNEFLDEQGKHNHTEWSIFDYRTWQYIVSDVLTKKDGIGQYLDNGECKKIAKYMQDEWSKRLSVEQRTTELPKGEDYGIDGLYAAIDILQKTLGKVDGYQSDDGILEHKCAISAVKELSKQKPAWSEEDENVISLILSICNDFLKSFEISSASTKVVKEDVDKIENWLKSLRPQSSWKPSDEQMLAINTAINVFGKGTVNGKYLIELQEQLKKLRE